MLEYVFIHNISDYGYILPNRFIIHLRSIIFNSKIKAKLLKFIYCLDILNYIKF